MRACVVFLQIAAAMGSRNLLYFHGGGLSATAYFGALQYLESNYDLSEWAVGGSSGGALVAMMSCHEERNRRSLLQAIIEDTIEPARSFRTFASLNQNFYQWTLRERPRFNETCLAGLHIGISPLSMMGQMKACKLGVDLFTDIVDYEDLVGAVIASHHVPGVMDGNPRRYTNREAVARVTLWSTWRGKGWEDGGYLDAETPTTECAPFESINIISRAMLGDTPLSNDPSTDAMLAMFDHGVSRARLKKDVFDNWFKT